MTGAGPAAAFLAGLAIGLAAASLLLEPSDCCHRVAMGVREVVGEKLGHTAQAIGDAIGFWDYAPGILTALGVD